MPRLRPHHQPRTDAVMISFTVHGNPAPQGSKIRTRYSMRESSEAVMPWREAIKAAIHVQDIPCTPGPVFVSITFRFERPKSHYGTGKNASRLKPSADPYPVGRQRGDIDKLERSSFDALTQGGAITDDAYIVRNLTAKVWCGPAERAGATICIAPMRTAPDNDGSQP
ncbi:RusA family crossover junction endodeoxyribonuclease [Propionibacteriaceae bacterium Y2011]